MMNIFKSVHINRLFKISISLLIVFVVTSCKQNDNEELWRHIEISPKDKSQMITVITKANTRYFINGKHSEIPKDGYLLLDISKVDKLGDGVSVCWNEPNYNWKLTNTYATLVENKLDTSKFLFYQPMGKYGEPVSDGYLGDNCGGILIRENIEPRGNLRIIYN